MPAVPLAFISAGSCHMDGPLAPPIPTPRGNPETLVLHIARSDLREALDDSAETSALALAEPADSQGCCSGVEALATIAASIT